MNYLKLGITLLIFAICFLAYNSVSAQSLLQNPATVNVDDLSDAQIRQLMQQAQSSGLSDDQLIQYAQSKGMSDTQIQRLQARIADIRRKSNNNTQTYTDTL